jgi:hypothetical protein
MKAVKIEECKKGEYIKRKPEAKTVFKREHYDAATKSYCLSDCDDMNREIFLKRGTIVYIDFEY